MIDRLAVRLANLSGWRRRFLWLVSGAVAVLALPPFFFAGLAGGFLPYCSGRLRG